MRAFLPFLATIVFGCSAASVRVGTTSSTSGSTGSFSGSTGSTSGGEGGASGGSNASAGVGGGLVFEAGAPDGMAPGTAEVFGETASTLYKLDPTTNVITVVGDFSGCSDVIDLALDKDGNMFVTTFSGFYTVDKTTAVCTKIKDGTYPNSLSFVPQGTLDPNVEALVGYNGSDYVRIDTTTGAVTTVASGALGDLSSSGDVVSVIGGGTYLTVTGTGCESSDCIIEVDPATGALKTMIGQLGHSGVYGLAFWGGAAYGFDAEGDVFQIDLTTAATTSIPVPNPPPDLSWYGAGSTTSAPLTMTQ